MGVVPLRCPPLICVVKKFKVTMDDLKDGLYKRSASPTASFSLVCEIEVIFSHNLVQKRE